MRVLNIPSFKYEFIEVLARQLAVLSREAIRESNDGRDVGELRRMLAQLEMKCGDLRRATEAAPAEKAGKTPPPKKPVARFAPPPRAR